MFRVERIVGPVRKFPDLVVADIPFSAIRQLYGHKFPIRFLIGIEFQNRSKHQIGYVGACLVRFGIDEARIVGKYVALCIPPPVHILLGLQHNGAGIDP